MGIPGAAYFYGILCYMNKFKRGVTWCMNDECERGELLLYLERIRMESMIDELIVMYDLRYTG